MADLLSLYGRGFQYPPAWDASTGGLAETAGLDSVGASLRRLFDVSPGEDRFNPGYGSGLMAFVFEVNSPAFPALIDTVLRAAIKRWEPRIQAVTALSVVPDDTNPGVVHIQLSVLTIQSAVPQNYVFPFALPTPA